MLFRVGSWEGRSDMNGSSPEFLPAWPGIDDFIHHDEDLFCIFQLVSLII